MGFSIVFLFTRYESGKINLIKNTPSKKNAFPQMIDKNNKRLSTDITKYEGIY